MQIYKPIHIDIQKCKYVEMTNDYTTHSHSVHVGVLVSNA